jgi:hypothetical protein
MKQSKLFYSLEIEMKKAGEVPELPPEAEEVPEVSDDLSATG